MRTVEVKVYKYDELSEDAKQNALSKLSDINVTHQWWDFLYEDANTVGIVIHGFDIYRGTISAMPDKDYSEIKSLIEKNHGKDSETVKTVTKYDVDDEIDCYAMFYDLKQDYLSLLKQQFEHLMSEDAVVESIKANEYEFFEDGTLTNFN